MATHALTTYKQKYERALATSKRVREKAGEVTRRLVDAGLCSGSAFMLGAWEGHSGPGGAKLFKMPAGLVLGGGALFASIMGAGGRGAEEHLASVGNGLLAAQATLAGMKFGADWKATGAFPGVKNLGKALISGDDWGDGDGATMGDLEETLAAY